MKRAFWPTSRLGWWAFGLGVAVIGRIIVSLLWSCAESWFVPSFLTEVVFGGWLCTGIGLILGFVTMGVAITALREGERSWMALSPFLAVFVQVLLWAYWILLFIYISVIAYL